MIRPVRYYGGKSDMWPIIQNMIPKHSHYCEPFFGGGTVFFLKDPVKIETINEKDPIVYNFYHQLQTNFDELASMVESTLYSEYAYREARKIITGKMAVSDVRQAWAFFILVNFSRARSMDGGFVINNDAGNSGKIGRFAAGWAGVRRDFMYYKGRLDNVQLLCRDGVDVMRAVLLNEECWAYIDTPYVGADQGHYSGYKLDEFLKLLDVLVDCKCMWLLSSYNVPELEAYTVKHRWNKLEVEKHNKINGKRKVEVLTWNYRLEQKKLF